MTAGAVGRDLEALLVARAGPFAGDPEAIEALRRMHARDERSDPVSVLPDVHPSRIPRHVAMIMDGNGRWAEQSGQPRLFGHQSGADTVRLVLRESVALGVEYLTLYAFSTENWRRPDMEVAGLMELCIAYCAAEADELRKQNVRVRVIGDLGRLPAEVRGALDALLGATSLCTGTTLCLAINYGSRQEIVRAAQVLAERARRGELDPCAIDEEAIASSLDTAGMPDPDLLIRTGGDLRLSNYLLWQISYAEIHVTDVFWPDFRREDYHAALRDFASRSRRFGGLCSGGEAGFGPGGGA